jgi:hypothetical protein
MSKKHSLHTLSYLLVKFRRILFAFETSSGLHQKLCFFGFFFLLFISVYAICIHAIELSKSVIDRFFGSIMNYLLKPFILHRQFHHEGLMSMGRIQE